jgi:hypothetical protein
MYAVFQPYSFEPQSSPALNRKVEEGFVRLPRHFHDFVAYYWLSTGAGAGASLCVFENQASANAALDLTANFVPEHLAVLAGDPNVIRGEFKVYAHCGL